MVFVLGVIRGDDDDPPWTSWLSSNDRDQLRYIASRFLAPLPLAPFRSVATDDDDRFSAARSRGSIASQAGITAGSIGGGRSGKSINQNNTACGCRLASRQSRGRSSAKGLTLTFPSSSISTLDVSSPFHHHIIPSIWSFRLRISRIDTHSHTHSFLNDTLACFPTFVYLHRIPRPAQQQTTYARFFSLCNILHRNDRHSLDQFTTTFHPRLIYIYWAHNIHQPATCTAAIETLVSCPTSEINRHSREDY